MDVIGALVTFLKADHDVTAKTSRVWGGELPQSENANMPRYNVVVKRAGGGLIGSADRDYGDRRVDVDCWGSNLKEASDLYDACRAALAGIERETVTVGGVAVLIHWARESSGGITARDPDTQWPTCMGSFQVLAAEIAA